MGQPAMWCWTLCKRGAPTAAILYSYATVLADFGNEMDPF